jgi:hypothetical protein
MLGWGIILTLTVWLMAVALAIVFGLMNRAISRGEAKWYSIFTGVGNFLKAIVKPRNILATILVVVGLCLIASSVSYTYFEATTGYRYELLRETVRTYVPELGKIVSVPGYSLWETPIVTTQIITLVDAFRIALGIYLILIGLLFAAGRAVEATNRAYGVT